MRGPASISGSATTSTCCADSVHGFAQDQIAPRADEIDRTNTFPRDLWPQMGALGLHGITVEEEYGGAGLGYSRPLRRDGGDLARLGLGRPVLRRAFQSLRQPDPPQRHRRAEAPLSAQADLRRACRRAGDVGAGRRLRRRLDDARAPTRRGDRYVLNGTKMWITNGPIAETLVVYAKTDPTAGAARHHRLPGREGLQGLFHRAEARQARHARLRHLRARVRGLRGAGGERARPGRRGRQRADVRARLRARRAGRRSARHHAGLPRRGDALRARAQAVRPADRHVPAHAGQARRHVCDDERRQGLCLCGGARLRRRPHHPRGRRRRHPLRRRERDADGARRDPVPRRQRLHQRLLRPAACCATPSSTRSAPAPARSAAC